MFVYYFKVEFIGRAFLDCA